MIDDLDLVTFNTYFLAPEGLAGDFNGDHVVNAADYTLWRNNFGGPRREPAEWQWRWRHDWPVRLRIVEVAIRHVNLAGAGGLAASAVPEPGSLLLTLLGLVGIAGFRRRWA